MPLKNKLTIIFNRTEHIELAVVGIHNNCSYSIIDPLPEGDYCLAFKKQIVGYADSELYYKSYSYFIEVDKETGTIQRDKCCVQIDLMDKDYNFIKRLPEEPFNICVTIQH